MAFPPEDTVGLVHCLVNVGVSAERPASPGRRDGADGSIPNSAAPAPVHALVRPRRCRPHETRAPPWLRTNSRAPSAAKGARLRGQSLKEVRLPYHPHIATAAGRRARAGAEASMPRAPRMRTRARVRVRGERLAPG